MSLVIDSHQHFWDRTRTEFDHSWQEAEQLAPICRSFLPADLQPLLEQTGVDYSVFVQTQHNIEENRWVLQLAEQNEFIAGIVGWVDLQSPDCEHQVAEFNDHPAFVGVRHVVQDEPDDDFIIRQPVLEGLKVLERYELPYDLLFFGKHLKHAAAVADHVPNLRLVIDHLSKPEIKLGEFAVWRKEISEAARRPNLWCKLSGMITEADWQNWSADQLKPYVDTALQVFGPNRLMFGSDWPVCLLAGTYQQVWDALMFCIDDLSPSEKAMILGQTAADFYSLNI